MLTQTGHSVRSSGKVLLTACTQSEAINLFNRACPLVSLDYSNELGTRGELGGSETDQIDINPGCSPRFGVCDDNFGSANSNAMSPLRGGADLNNVCLGFFCSFDSPTSRSDVQARLEFSFPLPIDSRRLSRKLALFKRGLASFEVRK